MLFSKPSKPADKPESHPKPSLPGPWINVPSPISRKTLSDDTGQSSIEYMVVAMGIVMVTFILVQLAGSISGATLAGIGGGALAALPWVAVGLLVFLALFALFGSVGFLRHLRKSREQLQKQAHPLWTLWTSRPHAGPHKESWRQDMTNFLHSTAADAPVGQREQWKHTADKLAAQLNAKPVQMPDNYAGFAARLLEGKTDVLQLLEFRMYEGGLQARVIQEETVPADLIQAAELAVEYGHRAQQMEEEARDAYQANRSLEQDELLSQQEQEENLKLERSARQQVVEDILKQTL
jgi:hypothetical protein